MAGDDGSATPPTAGSGRSPGAARTDGGASTPAYRLPPPGATPTRVLAVSGETAGASPAETLAAVDDRLDPDRVLAVPPKPSQVVPLAGRALSTPVITRTGVRVEMFASPATGVALVVPPNVEELSASPAETLDREGLPETPSGSADEWGVHLVSDRLALEVDRHDRSATVRGVEAYLNAVGEGWTGDAVTHLSTALRPGYETTVEARDETVRVVGVGESRARLGAAVREGDPAVARLDLYANGVVDAASVTPTEFGLRSLRGVGRSRAETLREAGYTTVEEVAAARTRELASHDGVGTTAAAEIRTRAEARATGTVRPIEDRSLPDGDPVYVDLETDGLAPTTAWLIGVLDGDPEDGDYMAFRQRDPTDRRTHLTAFLDWLTGAQADRPVVAYNGLGFDFPTLRRLVQEHCPAYRDAWESVYTFDPYHWAVTEGNAALPGRTDRLEDVATALGWRPFTRGVDGRRVAEVWVEWEQAVLEASDPSAVADPDWERLEAYCEDDVRALATVYEALNDAVRLETASTPTGSDTAQGSLGDFT